MSVHLIDTQEFTREITATVSLERTLFLDIETGATEDPIQSRYYIEKIKAKVMSEKYRPRSNWNHETNKKKEEEFEKSKPTRVINAISAFSDTAPLDPYANRIVIAGFLSEGNVTQITELEASEKEIVEKIAEEIQKHKIIVTYNGEAFDILTFKIKAAKYGIKIPPVANKHIDLLKIMKVWGIGKPVVASLYDFCAAVGIEIPDMFTDVDPSLIGSVFKSAREGLASEVKEKVNRILEYNKQDLILLQKLWEKVAWIWNY